MKFEDIFKESGMYVADSFDKGVAFDVDNMGNLFLKTYKNESDVYPTFNNVPFSKGLLSKDYKKVFTRQELFKK